MANPAENNVKNESPVQENKMGVMPVGKLLFSMSLPIMISMLVQALYNVVDSMFVARVSENALTALDKKLGALNTRLADLQRQVENAREELEKPFPQEDELREKSARLVELNAELDMENTAEPQEAEKPSVLAKLKEPIPLYEPKQHQAKEACR